MPEMRRDPVTGQTVIIATDRAMRPESFTSSTGENIITELLPEHVDNCPFCYGNESMTPPETAAWRNGGEADASGWEVRVVPNKYPVLNENDAFTPPVQQGGLFQGMQGYGVHEVIIETPVHNRHPGDISVSHMRTVIESYHGRFISLLQNKLLHTVIIFRNYKKEAGASVEHPHTQLVALPFIPLKIREEIEGAHRFYFEESRCPYCLMIEEDRGKRIICNNEDFVAIVPFAARLPFETWIMPRVHNSSFGAIQEEKYESLSRIITEVMQRISACLDDPPYNYYIHSAPYPDGSLPYYHWHIEICPRLVTAAGFEMGSGMHINVAVPEDAARFLREVKVKGNVYA